MNNQNTQILRHVENQLYRKGFSLQEHKRQVCHIKLSGIGFSFVKCEENDITLILKLKKEYKCSYVFIKVPVGEEYKFVDFQLKVTAKGIQDNPILLPVTTYIEAIDLMLYLNKIKPRQKSVISLPISKQNVLHVINSMECDVPTGELWKLVEEFASIDGILDIPKGELIYRPHINKEAAKEIKDFFSRDTFKTI